SLHHPERCASEQITPRRRLTKSRRQEPVNAELSIRRREQNNAVRGKDRKIDPRSLRRASLSEQQVYRLHGAQQRSGLGQQAQRQRSADRHLPDEDQPAEEIEVWDHDILQEGLVDIQRQILDALLKREHQASWLVQPEVGRQLPMLLVQPVASHSDTS